jgi:hypothetical protein
MTEADSCRQPELVGVFLEILLQQCVRRFADEDSDADQTSGALDQNTADDQIALSAAGGTAPGGDTATNSTAPSTA